MSSTSTLTRLRRRAALVSVLALLPALVLAVLVQPVALGQASQFGIYSMTVLAASTNTTGDVGAGGGLAPIDSGAPVVRGRLDSSPTGSMLAAAVEPGTLYRTVAGVANSEAGEAIVPTEDALAEYPGGPEEDVSDPSGTGQEGEYATQNGYAKATAGPTTITGVATSSEQVAGDSSASSAATDAATRASAVALRDGLLALAATYPTAVTVNEADESTFRSEGSEAEATSVADPAGGTLVAVATAKAKRVTFLGQFQFDDVVGTAVVRVEGGEHTADATLSYGGMSVGGVPVTITDDGVAVADDVPLLPGQDAAALEDQLNEVIGQAGVRFEPISPREETGDQFAIADSGGVKVFISTPANPGVPGNTTTVVLGQAVSTVATEPPFAAPAPLPTGTPPPDPAPAPTSSATAVPVTPPRSTISRPTPTPTESPVAVAPPTTAPPTAQPDTSQGTGQQVLVAGRRFSRKALLALLAAWQMLTLAGATVTTFALKRAPSDADDDLEFHGDTVTAW